MFWNKGDAAVPDPQLTLWVRTQTQPHSLADLEVVTDR